MEVWLPQTIEVLHQFFLQMVELILHLDQTLSHWSQWMGPWLYLVIFLIIFAETGLVVTPFLPGDSLLFALGALTALPESGLKLEYLIPLILLAAFLGDNTNYFFGRWIGLKLFEKEDSKIFNRKYLTKAQAFYALHGARAIVIGRFMPIVRTFVPFVAGVGRMPYRRYISFSLFGALIWIHSFLLAGHFFGNLPAVKTNFHIVIFGVILVSMLPLFFELWKWARAPKGALKNY